MSMHGRIIGNFMSTVHVCACVCVCVSTNNHLRVLAKVVMAKVAKYGDMRIYNSVVRHSTDSESTD